MSWFPRKIPQEALEEEIKAKIETRDYSALTERARREGGRKTRDSYSLTSTVAETILDLLLQSYDDPKAFQAIVDITADYPETRRNAYSYLNQKANSFPYVLALLGADDVVKNRHSFVLGGAEQTEDHENLGKLVRIVIKENIPVLDSLLQELQRRGAVGELVALAKDMDDGKEDVNLCTSDQYRDTAIKCLHTLAEIGTEDAQKGMVDIALSSKMHYIKAMALETLDRAGVSDPDLAAEIAEIAKTQKNSAKLLKPNDYRNSLILRTELGLLKESEYLSEAATSLAFALSEPKRLIKMAEAFTEPQRKFLRETFQRAGAKFGEASGLSSSYMTCQWDAAVYLVSSHEQALTATIPAEDVVPAPQGAELAPGGAGS